MSDVGKITEIEPEDQLGWIEMENGDRVRFGGTACKGFVPEVGMTVRVLGTRPGYGGTVKATGLEKVQGPAGAGPRAVAATAGGASDPAAPPPRKNLHLVQSAAVRADDVLLKILGRADMDDALHADLKALGFEPRAGADLGCNNPWVYVVAVDRAGNGYALYRHPMVAAYPQDPWVFYDKASDHVHYLAAETPAFFQALVAGAATGEASAAAPRATQTLAVLGVPQAAAAPLELQPASWLPPSDADLRPLDDYLGESDGGEMERGLLAYVSRKGDSRAQAALDSLYQAWGWSPG